MRGILYLAQFGLFLNVLQLAYLVYHRQPTWGAWLWVGWFLFWIWALERKPG